MQVQRISTGFQNNSKPQSFGYKLEARYIEPRVNLVKLGASGAEAPIERTLQEVLDTVPEIKRQFDYLAAMLKRAGKDSLSVIVEKVGTTNNEALTIKGFLKPKGGTERPISTEITLGTQRNLKTIQEEMAAFVSATDSEYKALPEFLQEGYKMPGLKTAAEYTV